MEIACLLLNTADCHHRSEKYHSLILRFPHYKEIPATNRAIVSKKDGAMQEGSTTLCDCGTFTFCYNKNICMCS